MHASVLVKLRRLDNRGSRKHDPHGQGSSALAVYHILFPTVCAAWWFRSICSPSSRIVQEQLQTSGH